MSVSAGEVTLSGRVTSWAQRDAAERAAAHAPGIVRIHNEIVVADDEPDDEKC